MRIVALIVLTVILLVNFTAACNAGGLAGIEVGGGPNLGYLAYDDPLEIWEAGWAVGFAGGIGFEIPLSDRMFFLPGARFSSLTNNVEIDDPDIKGEYSVNHKMISAPVLLRYELVENMIFLDAGPEFSFFLSSELNADYVELGIPHDKTDDISDEVDDFNISGCFRIGFKAARWNIPVAVTAGYHHGFTGAAAKDEWLSDWKTREITVTVSYLFDLLK